MPFSGITCDTKQGPSLQAPCRVAVGWAAPLPAHVLLGLLAGLVGDCHFQAHLAQREGSYPTQDL